MSSVGNSKRSPTVSYQFKNKTAFMNIISFSFFIFLAVQVTSSFAQTPDNTNLDTQSPGNLLFCS